MSRGQSIMSQRWFLLVFIIAVITVLSWFASPIPTVKRYFGVTNMSQNDKPKFRPYSGKLTSSSGKPTTSRGGPTSSRGKPTSLSGKPASSSGKPTSSSEFSFASSYGDHMVLQRAPSRASIWGYSGAHDQRVSVNLKDKTYETYSYLGPEDKYIWRVILDPITEPGPYTIAVKSGTDVITLRDVLFGDVWLCSGQSNMFFEVYKLINATKEINDSKNYPGIRVMHVFVWNSEKPRFDLRSKPRHQWVNPQIDDGMIKNFSAVCWLYGKYLHQKLKYPIGLISASIPGTCIETWSSPWALQQCGITKPLGYEKQLIYQNPEQNAHSTAWYAMIHPLLNITLTGIIWYQGEYNVLRHQRYACSFPTMIDDWRSKFSEGTKGLNAPLLPFGFVQLSPYEADFLASHLVPDLRWSQTAQYGYVPNNRMKKVFMAVAMDLPDLGSPYHGVHPRFKEDVAHRLVKGALAIAYGSTDIVHQGPFPTSIDAHQGEREIKIFYKPRSFKVIDSSGFEIYCPSIGDKTKAANWTEAKIKQSIYEHVTIDTTRCGERSVTSLRYAWKPIPCGFKKCAIYGKDSELPAPPFKMNLNKR